MKTKQVSVFVANRVRLASVARILKHERLNIRAVSLADAPDFGIFRFIVEDTERAVKASRSQGFLTDVSEVVGVEVDDHPGGLADVLDTFAANSLNVEYMYAVVTELGRRAILFFRFEDSDRAVEVLERAGVPVIWGERLWKAVGSEAAQ